MRKWILWALLPVLLCGCGREETFEIVSDEAVVPVMASPRQIAVDLPEDAVSPVLDQEGEQIYLCDGYDIFIEICTAGDVGTTVRSLSGCEKEDLTVMETQWDNVTRYEFVWAAAGEQGDRLGRAVILDDGNYHYCMSILRDAEGSSQIVWDQVFTSFDLV